MNAREAKRYVAHVCAESLRSDMGSAAQWVYRHHATREPFSEADQDRIVRAVDDLIDEMHRRSGNGGEG